ncbi:MAG: LysM peptidoglycan-binding domain-containing M23 family metallopeptidase [Synergistaceae bacterium]|nr:LysM peptidoglycan-binding domain-containing M23 family metallopeptidase [Synergistaceae bacterium]
MRKRNSPSPFGVFGSSERGKRRVYLSTLAKKKKRMTAGRLGCYLAIFVMLAASAMLVLEATDRTVGTAWGGLVDSPSPEDFVLPASGFIVIEMSDSFIEEGDLEGEIDLGFLFSSRGVCVEPCLLPVKGEDTPQKRPAAPENADTYDGVVAAECRSAAEFNWPFSRFLGGGVGDMPFTSKSVTTAGESGFEFPEHLVQKGGQYGGSGLGSGFGVSRMTVFQPRSPGGLSMGDSSFATINGALFANSAVSCSPFSKGGAKAAGDPADSYASDYETVILSVGEDGEKALLLDEEDLGEESEEVVLAKVDVLWTEHVVKLGQTLSDIAMAHGVSINDIMKANELKNANRLSEKQILLIPNDSSAVEATLEQVLTRKARLVAAREKVLPIKITAYVVAEGDSLWSISNSQNLEIDTLIGCNNLNNINVIRPGITLRVPNQDGIFYKVKKGDALAGIAKKFSITVERIKEANGKDAEPLVADKEIFLPGARPETTQAKGSAGKVTAASRNYRWPVVGKINSPFGWRRHPITRRRDFHTGIDIKSPRGRAIHASKAGVVEYSGWMGGYGKVVVIKHNDGNSTLYAHCSTLSVRKGQKIAQGQAIATVGTTGRTTGPHLHFEIRRGKSPVNPLGLLK